LAGISMIYGWLVSNSSKLSGFFPSNISISCKSLKKLGFLLDLKTDINSFLSGDLSGSLERFGVYSLRGDWAALLFSVAAETFLSDCLGTMVA